VTRLDDPGQSGAARARAAHRAGSPRIDQPRAGAGADSETTAVLTGMRAVRGPARPRGPEPVPADVPASRRAVPDHDDVDEPEPEPEDTRRGLAGRLTSRPVLAAVGVGVVLAVAAVVALFTASQPDPAPTEAAPAAVTAPVAPPPAPSATPAADPERPEAVAFLTALRDADIPTSTSGQAETEAAAAICAQLDQGADEAQLARSVPAVLPDVTRAQASDVVDLAQQHYC
jgi:hypothetical protein